MSKAAHAPKPSQVDEGLVINNILQIVYELNSSVLQTQTTNTLQNLWSALKSIQTVSLRSSSIPLFAPCEQGDTDFRTHGEPRYKKRGALHDDSERVARLGGSLSDQSQLFIKDRTELANQTCVDYVTFLKEVETQQDEGLNDNRCEKCRKCPCKKNLLRSRTAPLETIPKVETEPSPKMSQRAYKAINKGDVKPGNGINYGRIRPDQVNSNVDPNSVHRTNIPTTPNSRTSARGTSRVHDRLGGGSGTQSPFYTRHPANGIANLNGAKVNPSKYQRVPRDKIMKSPSNPSHSGHSPRVIGSPRPSVALPTRAKTRSMKYEEESPTHGHNGSSQRFLQPERAATYPSRKPSPHWSSMNGTGSECFTPSLLPIRSPQKRRSSAEIPKQVFSNLGHYVPVEEYGEPCIEDLDFFADFSREESHDLLKKHGNGSFLLRPCSDPTTLVDGRSNPHIFSLSYCKNTNGRNDITSIKILRKADGYSDSQERVVFKSVWGFIEDCVPDAKRAIILKHRR